MPPPATFTTSESVPTPWAASIAAADVVVIVDVAADRGDAVAELLGQRGAPIDVAIEDRHAHAEPDEVAHGGAAETPRSTGDER